MITATDKAKQTNSLTMPSDNRPKLDGVLDNQLSFSAHVANLLWSCRFLFYNKKIIRRFLPIKVTFCNPLSS